MGYSRKSPRRGGGGGPAGEGGGGGCLRTNFFLKTEECLGLSLYPRKFQTKQSFAPEKIPQNCVTPLELPRH